MKYRKCWIRWSLHVVAAAPRRGQRLVTPQKGGVLKEERHCFRTKQLCPRGLAFRCVPRYNTCLYARNIYKKQVHFQSLRKWTYLSIIFSRSKRSALFSPPFPCGLTSAAPFRCAHHAPVPTPLASSAPGNTHDLLSVHVKNRKETQNNSGLMVDLGSLLRRCRSTAALAMLRGAMQTYADACPRAGWISMLLLEWLRKQCSHPARELARKSCGSPAPRPARCNGGSAPQPAAAAKCSESSRKGSEIIASEQ